MVNRARIKVPQLIETITYDLDGSIDDAIKYLQKTKNKYPDAYVEYGDISGSYEEPRNGIALKIMVEETDKQYEKRIAGEEHWEKRREENERKQYEALKAKFEN